MLNFWVTILCYPPKFSYFLNSFLINFQINVTLITLTNQVIILKYLLKFLFIILDYFQRISKINDVNHQVTILFHLLSILNVHILPSYNYYLNLALIPSNFNFYVVISKNLLNSSYFPDSFKNYYQTNLYLNYVYFQVYFSYLP